MNLELKTHKVKNKIFLIFAPEQLYKKQTDFWELKQTIKNLIHLHKKFWSWVQLNLKSTLIPCSTYLKMINNQTTGHRSSFLQKLPVVKQIWKDLLGMNVNAEYVI